MAYSKAANEAAKRYKSQHIKRIPLDVQIEDYERIREAAEKAGRRVNSYIKEAIEMRMEADSDIHGERKENEYEA